MNNQKIKRPGLALWLLEFTAHETYNISAAGDAEEMYTDIFLERSRRKAFIWIWRQVLRSVPLFLYNSFLWSMIMLKNYLKIAFRNILKYKVYSFINISGLAVGMACVLLIGLYIQDELSYDRYHENSDRIYRLTKSSKGASFPDWIGTQAPLAPALKEKFPEIEDYVRFDPFIFKNKILISHENKSFYEEKFYLADPSIFKVFSFKLIKGNPESVLRMPANLVISKSMAEKYFGDNDPIGEIIKFDGKTNFSVSGVMENVPSNSHFKFDFAGSFENLDRIYGKTTISNSWGRSNYYTYLLLKDGVNPREFEKKCSSFIAGITEKPLTKVFLEPVPDIHLFSIAVKDPEPHGDINNVYLYSAIALVILLIACINFMNLYTANSEVRSREVGMRKVLGAHKKQLVSQFLGESFMLSLLALPAAVLLFELAVPLFNSITGKSLDIEYTKNLIIPGGLVFLTILVGLAAGSYPAFFISSFRPVKILRGKPGLDIKGINFRNFLVVFQFAASIILITGSLVINSQMRFIKSKGLGYNRENIVNIPIYSPETKSNFDIYRDNILDNANVTGATATSYTPSIERWREGMYFEGRKENDEIGFFRMSGDYNIIDLFGMEIIRGRNFSRSFPSDLKKGYLLNESAVNAAGWNVDGAVGKEFGGSREDPGRVIGVLKNFNFRSLRYGIPPMAINIFPRMYQYISIKIKPGDIQGTIGFLESKWKELNPAYPFEFYFYDDEFDKLYKADLRLEELFKYFTFLAIFIACLGLFGLSLFTVSRRTKEISIRKVLGAGVPEIVFMLLKNLLKLVLAASVLAVPTAWFFMDTWLRNFEYKTPSAWTMYALAGIAALIIALGTVSYHSIKAACTNPVDALKNE